MAKIAFIGAGSVVFTRNLANDILLVPALRDSTIALMDIDPERLRQALRLTEAVVAQRGAGATVTATLDRREALKDADYVITTFQAGGIDAYRLDVEIPCLVDGNGVQPTPIGSLPPQLAALNRSNVNVQELAVEAAASGDVEAVYHAVMLDPLTAAVCTLPQIEKMVTEMLAAQAQWLPDFA